MACGVRQSTAVCSIGQYRNCFAAVDRAARLSFMQFLMLDRTLKLSLFVANYGLEALN